MAVMSHFQLCSVHYTMLQEQYKNVSETNSVTTKVQVTSLIASQESFTTLCIVRWDTKWDKGKFMVCALYILWLAKRSEASEEIKYYYFT